MYHRHLVIMAKTPEAGRVKTRLARDIGVAEAVRIYRVILARTVRRLCSDPRWQTWIAVSPDTALLAPVWPLNTHLTVQGTGDLGQRMQRVFDLLPTGPAVIIGSDTPGIGCSDIAEAFAALGDNDAVFGPATDGGYWLVGQRRMPKILRIFRGVRWSSKYALKDTLANLKTRRTATIRKIADLDKVTDYRRWKKSQLQV